MVFNINISTDIMFSGLIFEFYFNTCVSSVKTIVGKKIRSNTDDSLRSEKTSLVCNIKGVRLEDVENETVKTSSSENKNTSDLEILS